ncbi:RIP metalloprotease RseP [Tabrizicola sp. KVB23]|uniref:Zinc metalloprotease n=1 Tax=Fuscibacter oryzae TaxID=2803939 RepID=A0A8J7MP07_9RHOB|nr:RIP metalloprotease RseP [Fuscibacter oryzae]
MSDILSRVGGLSWTVAFFVIALGIIVAVHEYGHYIIGRWSGIHAEVFSLGFGPVLFKRRDKRGTQWQLAAVPLGGYVKFLGDSNAAAGQDAGAMAGLSAEERRHTMHGAPLWARAATVAAGPIFNFILALAVFVGMIQWQGIATGNPTIGKLPAYPFDGPSLLVGDRILSIAGQPTPDLEALAAVADKLPAAPAVTYQVERAGQTVDVHGPHPMPPLVKGVQPTSAAMKAGIQAGDVVLQAGGQPVYTFDQLRETVGGSGGKPVDLTIWREGKQINLSLTPERRDMPLANGGFETRWLLGLSGGLMIEPELRHAGALESVKLAAQQGWLVAKSSLSGLWHVVTGAISRCNISGPIGMAEVLGDAARSGPMDFLSILATLSLGIGLINLFPIPVLDGGHLVFHVYEALTGRAPSARILGLLMTVGLAVVLSFMAFALTNDLSC